MISLWQASMPQIDVAASKFDADRTADIAILGAGYSGLWSAYYLKKLIPTARITIFEAAKVGFGASGRNGGWCSGFLPISIAELAHIHGRDAAIEMMSQSIATLDEIKTVLLAENIDCDFVQGGTIQGATNAVQVDRVVNEVQSLKDFGYSDDDLRLISDHDLTSRINLTGLKKASFTPHCAVIHPLKLVHGLAKLVRDLGVKIFENTPVIAYQSGLVKTSDFNFRADVIVRATEGFTAQIKQHRRTLAPLYSYMVATAPLTDSQISSIGWCNRETYHDARNMIIYSQLTKDRRIAFGGRGAPYHFASNVKPEFDNDSSIHRKIIDSMHAIFPVTKNVEITHKWGGPLGVPRNWQPSVNFDPKSGLASLGGYVGDGVAASNLAARTLAHLIANDNHPLTRLAWVNKTSRKWEVEPLRYIGINGLLKLATSIDNHEQKKDAPARIRTKILHILS